MNQLLTISNDAVDVLAWTLLHFFWQGALIAAALAGALTLLRNGSSHLRYGVACGALVLMAAMPLATGLWLSSSESAIPVAGDRPASMGPAAQAASSPLLATVPRDVAPASASPALKQTLEPALPWLVVMWLAGVVALSCIHLGGWLRVRRLRHLGVERVEPRWRQSCERLARRLGIRRPVDLLASTRVTVPTVIGWLKPVVLFPASTFTGLDPRQLESILAHELAHVRRNDYLINMLQVAMETLLFYHPAVWWASRQVRELREHCCDDLAVSVCGDRMTYARALADLEELRFAAPVFALGADGGSLLERIRRLAGARSQAEASGWMAPALAAAALVAASTILAFTGQPSIAQEAGTVDPAEIGIRAPALLPPMIIAQVTEESEPALPYEDVVAAPTPTAGAARATGPMPIDELIEMKRHGLDDLLDEVEGTAYADLPTRELLTMARYGVDRELIHGLDAAGYRDLQAAELVELAKFGVDDELIEELQAAGYDRLAVAELVALAKFGADSELIAELQAAGLGTPPVGDVVALAKFGVDGDYIQEMKAAGYDASIVELAEMAKFGVDSELMRELTAAGFDNLPAAELVRLAKFGVDGDYIQEMKAAGYQMTTTAELVALAKFGVDDELIEELAAAGFGGLSAPELVELSKYGIDGDYIQEMRGTVVRFTSTAELVALAKYGVDDELITELHELGYRDLSTEEIVSLSKYGVDGDFIRELREAGFENLSVEDLTRMARHGIDAEFLSKMSQRERI